MEKWGLTMYKYPARLHNSLILLELRIIFDLIQNGLNYFVKNLYRYSLSFNLCLLIQFV